jgi:UDPglucose 6-dehydrogenase
MATHIFESGRLLEEFSVGVVGAGYVGLVTGACLSHIGHHVTLVDIDEDRVTALREGEVPIYEPGLGELTTKSSGRLRFTTRLEPVVCEVDVLFIAVDTPPGDEGSADLSNVAAVARSIGRALLGAEREKPLIIVNKSTVPVGSGDYVSMLVKEGAEEAGGRRSELPGRFEPRVSKGGERGLRLAFSG